MNRERPHLEPGFYRMKYLVGIVHLNLSIDPNVSDVKRREHSDQAVVAVADLVAVVRTHASSSSDGPPRSVAPSVAARRPRATT